MSQYLCILKMLKNKKSSKNYSVAANKRTVDAVFNGNLANGETFAKVMKHLGDRQVSIYYENEKKQGHEGIATIAGVLKKNKTPVRSNDIVIVLPLQMTRDGSKMRFELRGILNPKEITDAKKKMLIPEYFVNNVDTDSFIKKDNKSAIEFDYEEETIIDDI